MVPIDNLLGFLVAAMILIVIPGPSVLFTIGRTLALGRLGGLLSVLGSALGLIPIDLAAGSVPLQLFQLGMLFVVLAFVCDSVWALAAGAAREWFGRSPKRLAAMSATGGGLMIGLGGVLALSGSKH